MRTRLRFLVGGLLTIVGTVTADGRALRAASAVPAEFPDSAYGDGRLARELRPADERPLAIGVSVDSGPVYRMVRLGAWGGAGILRLQRRGAEWQLVQTVTDNDVTRHVRYADSTTVSDRQADSVIAIIARSRFWTRPAPACHMGLDGYRIVLEARTTNEYHTINCWVPEEATAPEVVATVRAFEHLSGVAFSKPAIVHESAPRSRR